MKTKKTKRVVLLLLVICMVILSIPFVTFADGFETNPSVIISSNTTNPTTEGTVCITITFSADVFGFVMEDVVIGGVDYTTNSFKQIDAKTYTFMISSITDNTITIDIPAGVAEAYHPIPNTAAAQFSLTFNNSVIYYPITGGNLMFNQNAGSIINYIGTPNGSLEIPEEINGIKVEHIGVNALRASSITELILPEGLKSIGETAVAYCYGLQSLNIPSTLTEIGDYAFSTSIHLTNIEFADGLQILGNYMFYQCVELTTFDIPASVTKIPDGLFHLCSSLRNVGFNEGVTEIGNAVFSRISFLESVSIPSTVTKIGEDAFFYCHSIKSMILPESLIEIGDSAFSGCGFESIVIPDNTEYIGPGAFYYCFSLTSVTLPNSLTYIGSGAFLKCSLSEIIIPENVTFIGGDAFYKCVNLTSIYFMGNAPEFELSINTDYDYSAKVYYLEGATGFSDTLAGHQTALWIDEPVFGDVNGDGEINPMDATILNRYNACWPTYVLGINIIGDNCDLNNDGNINPLDGTILARHNANWSLFISLPFGVKT